MRAVGGLSLPPYPILQTRFCLSVDLFVCQSVCLSVSSRIYRSVSHLQERIYGAKEKFTFTQNWQFDNLDSRIWQSRINEFTNLKRNLHLKSWQMIICEFDKFEIGNLINFEFTWTNLRRNLHFSFISWQFDNSEFETFWNKFEVASSSQPKCRTRVSQSISYVDTMYEYRVPVPRVLPIHFRYIYLTFI